MFMVTKSFGRSEAYVRCTDPEHADAFVLWHRAREAENESLKTNARAYRVQRGKPLIVVVDDELVVAITLAEILQRHGQMAVWFTEPLRALDYLWGGPVDLLLSDITMPAMDGVCLATQAHAIRPACAILLFSAVAQEAEVMERMVRLGTNVELERKPLQVPCLLSKIDHLLVAGKSDAALVPTL
jgi:CheY-like chemotaxis protein